MKKRILPIIISLPIVSMTPFISLTSCGNGQEPTLIYRITLKNTTGGTINKQYVEVDAGAKWSTAKDRITLTPDEGMQFDRWTDEQGNKVDDNYVINKSQTFTCNWTNATFEKDSWSHLCSLANKQNGLQELKNFYHPEKGTFIGFERKIKLFGNEYSVRVIGEDHDSTSIGNKVALTFQLTSLVSNATGELKNTLFSKKEEANFDYLNSIIRKNVDGLGTGEGISPGSEVWSQSCLASLEEENPGLASSLKTVNKEFYAGGLGNTVYPTKAFILTASEIGVTGDMYHTKEGDIYEYWSSHSQYDQKIQKDLNQNPYRYALVTKRINDESNPNHIYVISDKGKADHIQYYNPAAVGQNFFGISFAFCI